MKQQALSHSVLYVIILEYFQVRSNQNGYHLYINQSKIIKILLGFIQSGNFSIEKLSNFSFNHRRQTSSSVGV